MMEATLSHISAKVLTAILILPHSFFIAGPYLANVFNYIRKPAPALGSQNGMPTILALIYFQMVAKMFTYS